MHNTILQEVNYFLNVKMINLEKINRKSVSPPPPPPSTFKNTCPCAIFPPLFLIFQVPPSRWYNQNLLLHFRKKGGEGGRKYEHGIIFNSFIFVRFEVVWW